MTPGRKRSLIPREEIKNLYKNGKSIESLSLLSGLTVERVKKIIDSGKIERESRSWK